MLAKGCAPFLCFCYVETPHILKCKNIQRAMCLVPLIVQDTLRKTKKDADCSNVSFIIPIHRLDQSGCPMDYDAPVSLSHCEASGVAQASSSHTQHRRSL